MSAEFEDSVAAKPPSQPNGQIHDSHDVESQPSVLEQPSTRLEPTRSHTSGANVEMAASPGETRQRRKTMTAESPSPVGRVFSRVGTLLHTAHAQDFERRRRPELGQAVGKDIGEDDDDDEDDDEATTDSEAEALTAAIAHKRHRGQDRKGGHKPDMEGDEGPAGNHTDVSDTDGTDAERHGQTAGGRTRGDEDVSDAQHMSNVGDEQV